MAHESEVSSMSASGLRPALNSAIVCLSLLAKYFERPGEYEQLRHRPGALRQGTGLQGQHHQQRVGPAFPRVARRKQLSRADFKARWDSRLVRVATRVQLAPVNSGSPQEPAAA